MQLEVLQSLFYGAVLVAIVALTARLLGILLTRVGLPDLLGALVAGVLLGPQMLGIVLPSSDTVYSEMLSQAARLGLVLLMTVGGLSLRTNTRTGEGRDILVWVAAAIAAFGLALATVSTFPTPSGLKYQGKSGAYALVLALAVVVTSVPFLTKVFIELDLLKTSLAHRILKAACVIDILVWTLYPLTGINTSKSNNYAIEAFISLLAVVSFILGANLFALLLNRLRLCLTFDSLYLDILLLLTHGMFCVFLMSQLYVHIMIASFFFGYMAQKLCDPQRIMKNFFIATSSSTFIPVYFAIIGASFTSMVSIDLLFIIIFLLWSFGIKGFCIYLASRFNGSDHHMATVLSVVLNTRGGPGIALAAVAFADAIIDERTFVTFITVAVATTVAAHFILERNKVLILKHELEAAEP